MWLMNSRKTTKSEKKNNGKAINLAVEWFNEHLK
jgi:hypothetical protein